MHTVNVYTLFIFYIHTHSWCNGDGNLLGEADSTNSDVQSDKNQGKHNTKNSHMHTKNHTIPYTQTHPVTWTQIHHINHNTASSWNYNNWPHCSTCKLLSITRVPILIPSRNLGSLWRYIDQTLQHILKEMCQIDLTVELDRQPSDHDSCKSPAWLGQRQAAFTPQFLSIMNCPT